MKYISVIFAWIALTMSVRSQEFFVQVISKEKGFGQSGINRLIEDHQGIVWAATALGLIRFDGTKAIWLLPEQGDSNSLSNEYIYDLFEDQDHNIWVATRNGLNCIDPSRKRITRYFQDSDDPTTIPANGIFRLMPNTDSTFFILSGRGGFAEFNRKTHRCIRLNPVLRNDSLHRSYAERFITEIWKPQRDFIFTRTNSGWFQYNRRENVLEAVRDTVTGFSDIVPLATIYQSKEKIYWFADIDGQLYKWLPNQYLESFCDPYIESTFLEGDFSIMDFNSNFILISNPNRVVLVNKISGAVQDLNLREDQRNVLSDNRIRVSLETSDGIIMLGSGAGNLLLIDPLHQQFKFKSIIHTLPGVESKAEISDFFEDLEFNHRFISAVQDSFFYVEDLISGHVTAMPKRKIPNFLLRWFLDSRGRLWLCDGSAVQQVNRENFSMTEFSPDRQVLNLFDMVEISPGVMLVASYLHGLFRFEPDKKIFTLIRDGKGWAQSYILNLTWDKKHQSAWIGTLDQGVFRYDVKADTFYHYKHYSKNPNSLGGNGILDITLDSSGHVWFSIEPAGISRFDYTRQPDSAFLNFTMGDGLPSSFISGMSTDVQGNIWMTSLNGIAHLNTQDFSIKKYKKSDGLPAARFPRGSIAVTPRNIVLIGWKDGYLYFDPQLLKINRAAPDIVMQDVLVVNKSSLPGQHESGFDPLNLKYNQNYLTFRFSVINFTDPENNVVRYILEGFDDDWITRSGITEVNYTKIPPGEYNFRIVAADHAGVWNTQQTVMLVNIRPAFWQTTWFYFLIGAGIASLAFAFYNFKLKQSIKQNRLIAEREFVKSESERQLSQLEMTALRAQMNPHFVFNCLNSINRFIVVNDNEAASEYLTKFSKLIRQVLDNSRGEKVLLSTEIDTLKLYIDMESLRFIDKFEYSISVDPEIEPATMVIQPMLIQPYVENAIWHGLMHRRTKGILKIHFDLKGESLLVTIEDNGVGRDMAKKIKESQLVTRKSHGMKVTAQRMALLSKKLNVPVEATVEDLYDAHQNPMGTCVHLILPLEKLNTKFETNPIAS